jgi:DNA-binding LytR/AlgR family response regulator
MPGLSGVDAARAIGRRAHLVFVTAFDAYAVEAFAQGALDYVVKPVQAARLADTVARLRERLREARAPSADVERLLQELTVRLGGPARASSLRWITAGSGATTRLIAVDEIDFLKSDEKYTLVAWRGADGRPAEAVVRMSLKDLVAQLDPQHFVQVHRSVVVNLRSVSHVTRGENETADIHLKGRPELLPVSRSYLHLFKQM